MQHGCFSVNHVHAFCHCHTLTSGLPNPASICPYRNRNEDDEDAHAPGDRLQDRRGIRLVEQQPTHRVDDERDWLMFREGTQPAGHAFCWHKRATGEGQREEPDETSGLCRLHAAHQQPDGCRNPREGKAGEQEQSYAAQPGKDTTLWSEANQQTDLHITNTTNVLRTRSEMVRPVRTADFAIGNERNRSTSPRCRSVARPIPVVVAPKMTVCAKMPAIR